MNNEQNILFTRTSLEKWDKMCADQEAGKRPVHRPREWKERERGLEKERKRQNWHQRREGQVSAPLIIDPTAGSLTAEMKEVCRKFEEVTSMRIQVQERAGNALKHLAKSEPLKVKSCKREDCFICTTSEAGKCEKNGIGYSIRCDTCLRAGKVMNYEGESGKNGYTRGRQHLDSLRRRDEENALWKHCIVEHNGELAEFSMKTIGVFSSCLARQINEAVRIAMSKSDCIMNSKSEFHQAPLVRVIPVMGLVEEQGAGGEPRQVVGGRRGRGVGRGRGAGGRGTRVRDRGQG